MASHHLLTNFLGIHELSTAMFYKAAFAELAGTAILMISICGSYTTLDQGHPQEPLVSAACAGLAVAMIIWTFNHISGAHINPSVSLSFMVTGQLSLVKTVVFIVMQCAGSIAGTAIVWYIIPDQWRGQIGATVLGKDVTVAQGFVAEMIATCFLILAVFASSDKNRSDLGGSMPLTIGLVVVMQNTWAARLTGCSMNPIRTLGPAVIAGVWDDHWLYWVAPTLGGVLGALIYKYILAQHPSQACALMALCGDGNDGQTDKSMSFDNIAVAMGPVGQDSKHSYGSRAPIHRNSYVGLPS
ncbi:aquaporin-like [Biomphalaria glabrata]|uniref:Aquaporin-like n=1 Tax=Biomphalaria glabrata TaxID=6526 RepID=A0A9W3AVL2_BIOGL|nr:aquaporin-like [Biomphalaria glabrata]